MPTTNVCCDRELYFMNAMYMLSYFCGIYTTTYTTKKVRIIFDFFLFKQPTAVSRDFKIKIKETRKCESSSYSLKN